MNREEATTLITSADAHERLQAARYFSTSAGAGDAEMLNSALEHEGVAWIKSALKAGLNQAEGTKVVPSEIEDELGEGDEEFARQVYADAVEDTTGRFMHEIEPIVGQLRLAARDEIPAGESSEVWGLLNRLDELLSAIESLSQSARAPRKREFDLGELVESTCDEVRAGHDVQIEPSGRRPQIIVGDPDLVRLALSNGLRNAVEATEEVNASDRDVIVVTWGGTAEDFWIVVLDRGAGLKNGTTKLWDIGVSSKQDHHGMGLAIAKTAMISLAGDISLEPRRGRGTSFEIRWPASNRESDENLIS